MAVRSAAAERGVSDQAAESERAPGDASDQALDDSSGQTAADASDQALDGVSGRAPDEESGQALDDSSGQTAADASDQALDGVSGRAPDEESDRTADAMSDQILADVSDQMPNEASEQAGGGSAGAPAHRPPIRRLLSGATSIAAGLLVLFALLVPNSLDRLAVGAFIRIPVEGLLAVAILLVLPGRAKPLLAALAGAVLGLITVVKAVDMGFYYVLARPFDPALDWTFFPAGWDFLTESIGRPGAAALAAGAGLLALVVPVLMTLSAVRMARVVTRHDAVVARGVAVAVVACVGCAALGVRVTPEVPAGALTYERLAQTRASLRDRGVFAEELAVDAFRDTPGKDLLTALRGKDVLITFIESYGRSAVEDPRLAPAISAVLADGDRRLRADGFAARSGFLTSPTAGGGSWLAHATLLSGLWVNNQQRYASLVQSDRLTLNGAFRRADWRTVGVKPGLIADWKEGPFFGHQKLYDSRNMGYRGPRFSFATLPDQYALSVFQRAERGVGERTPVMAEIALISSHAPWVPVPELIDWTEVGDGSIYRTQDADDPPDMALRSADRVRADYRRSIEYSLQTVISYVETYGDDDLVLVVLGDHQPAPVVTGSGASRDVPITIVTGDRAVLDRISGWGWQDGMKPGTQAPVWPMDAFRDRFLTAFGP